MPSIIRFDCSFETPIIVEAYFQLCLREIDKQEEMIEK